MSTKDAETEEQDISDEPEIRFTARAGIEYRVLTVSAAAEYGTEIELLAALRTEVARQISVGVSPRDLAALSKRLIELTRDIDAAEETEIETGEGVDDIPDAPLDPETL